jgi:hypothetical protein
MHLLAGCVVLPLNLVDVDRAHGGWIKRVCRRRGATAYDGNQGKNQRARKCLPSNAFR